jgi:hypothetical protein
MDSEAQTGENQMTSIASLGTNSAYVQLFPTLHGEEITLKATATEWCAMTGEMRKEELGEKTVALEEAQDAAADLQGLAKEFLDNTKSGRGWFSPNISFEQATARLLGQA